MIVQFGWLLVLSLWICCAAAFEPSFLAAKSIEGSFSERTAYPTKRVVNDDDVIAVATFRNQLTTPKMMVEAAKKKLGTKDNTAEALQGLKTGLLFVGPPIGIVQYLQTNSIAAAAEIYCTFEN